MNVEAACGDPLTVALIAAERATTEATELLKLVREIELLGTGQGLGLPRGAVWCHGRRDFVFHHEKTDDYATAPNWPGTSTHRTAAGVVLAMIGKES